ncbi:MAG: type II toxin-antitoxin system RelE/ParE family toxin [Bacteroidetes bacterium]|nr:type II toxin-antitoxin system RelE/ParE family toxin [Bacteroidota bacterium]
MNNYRIFETNEFLDRLEKIALRDRIFIKQKLISHVYPQLKEEPYFGKNIRKLVDYRPEMWRYRIGKYRVFYIIDDEKKIIFILSIDMRKDAY